MFQSYVVEINGVFIGAAVPILGGFRFRAVHPQVDELDGFSWYSLDELRNATGHLFRTGRLRTVSSAGAANPDPASASHATPGAESPLHP